MVPRWLPLLVVRRYVATRPLKDSRGLDWLLVHLRKAKCDPTSEVYVDGFCICRPGFFSKIKGMVCERCKPGRRPGLARRYAGAHYYNDTDHCVTILMRTHVILGLCTSRSYTVMRSTLPTCRAHCQVSERAAALINALPARCTPPQASTSRHRTRASVRSAAAISAPHRTRKTASARRTSSSLATAAWVRRSASAARTSSRSSMASSASCALAAARYRPPL